MNTKIFQNLLLSVLIISCNKTPATDEVVPREINQVQSSFKCSTPSRHNSYDIDSCVINACEFAGGHYSNERGCLCDDGESFTYEKTPKCVAIEIEYSKDRRVKEDHELIVSSVYTEESFYSANIYNYNLENDVSDLLLPNYVAPNFLTIYFPSKTEQIKEDLVDKSRLIPNVYIDQSFGDISPIYSVRFGSDTALDTEAPHYEVIANSLDKTFISDESEYYSELGCLGHCKKTMNIENDEFIVKRSKEFVKGVLAFDYVLITKKNESIASVKYDLMARTVLTIDKGSVDDRSISYQLSSFSMETSGKKKVKLIGNEHELELKTSLNDNWGNVVLCDNGILPNDKGNSNKNILVKGPNSSSIYGWLNEVRDQSDYYNGVLNLNALGSGVPGGSSHAQSVYNFMDKVNVASISLNSCLNDFQNWAQNTFEQGFHVVNYSYADYLDRNACLNNHKWREVEKSSMAKKMLWIFAAGNQKSYLTSESAKICPQNILSGRSNALIVGSSPTYGGVTNKGKDYVDIFADAPSTSTATAIVSSLAANIKKKYPALSIALVKKSIMASASNDDLPSRARGMLDIEKAFSAAKVLADNPFIRNIKLLRNIHCRNRRFLCSVDSSWTKRFKGE